MNWRTAKPAQRKIPDPPLTQTALLGLALTLTLAAAPHTGTLPFWSIPFFLLIVGWRGFLTWVRRPPPPRWQVLGITVLAVAGILATYQTLFGRDAGVALLTIMAACKLLESQGLRDGVVLVFLGYLLVMSNLLFSQDIPIVAYLLAAITLMLAAHILIHRQHAGLSAVAALRLAGRMVAAALPMMLILFLLFPRIPGPLWGLPKDAHQGRTGLSGEMEPGRISELIRSDAAAFRVRFSGPIPPPEQRYWRGPVLINFDGRRWTEQNEKPFASVPPPFIAEGSPIDYTVLLEPHNRHWLFALDLPARLPPNAGITSSFHIVREKPVNEVYRYEMRSYLQYRTGELTSTERLLNVRLPPFSNPRARELAETWRTRNPHPEALVDAALTLFREHPFIYTLNPPLLGAHSVDEFLFRTRQGFCEHYASAFVFLMRAAGVPARVVTGYQGGERNELGDYLVVRQSDAHAWAEVWLAERGWVRVDPTAAAAPHRIQHGVYGALSNDELPFLIRGRGNYWWIRNLVMVWDSLNIRWNEWVLAYGPERQKEFLSGLGLNPVDWRSMTVALIASLSGLSIIFLLWRKLRQRHPDPVVRSWQRFCHRLARRGTPRRIYEGPLDFTARAALHHPKWAAPIREIGESYARLRYGASPSSSEVRRLQRQISRCRI